VTFSSNVDGWVLVSNVILANLHQHIFSTISKMACT